MGSGLSMSSIIIGKSVIRNPEEPRELLLKLQEVGEHLRVFQHRFTGEVIVLIDQDPSQILTDYMHWDEVAVCSQQMDYFQRMRVTVSVDCQNVDFSTTEGNENVLTPTTNNDNISTNNSNSSPRSDDVRHDIKTSTPLPPIVKKNSDKRARVKKAADKILSNDGELPLRVNPVLMPKLLPGVTSRDENPLLTKHSTAKPIVLPKMVMKESKSSQMLATITNSSSSNMRLAPMENAPSQLHSSGQDLSEQSNSNYSCNQAEIVRISHANSEPIMKTDGLMGSAMPCHICGATFDAGTNLDVFEEHIMNCSRKLELKKCFVKIDEKLSSILRRLKETTTMPASSAIDGTKPEIEVENILSGVLNIRVDNVETPKINILLQELDVGIELLEKYHQQSSHPSAVADVAKSPSGSGFGLVALLRRRTLSFSTAQLSFLLNILKEIKQQFDEKRFALQKFGRCYNTYPSDFKFLKVIGKGGFSKVYLARRRDNGKIFAIKVLSKKQIRDEKRQLQVLRERIAMTHASKDGAEYFVKFHCSFQNSLHLFLVMEYAPCGDCLSLLMAVKKIPEHVAKHIIAQISLAVQHLHSHGVVHRDIKPDNILITDRGHVRLGDFGLASPFYKDMISTVSTPESQSAALPVTSAYSSASTGTLSTKNLTSNPSLNLGANIPATPNSNSHRTAMRQKSKVRGISLSDTLWLEDFERLDSGEPRITFQDWDAPISSSGSESICLQRPVEKNKLNSRVGNFLYACPEMVIGNGYDHTVDWWAVGVLLFHLVAGVTPFESSTGQKDDTLDSIIFNRINWDSLPSDISVDCKDFISKHLSQEPESRMGYFSSQDVLNHPFFQCFDFKKLYQEIGPLYPMTMDQAGRPLPFLVDGLPSAGRNGVPGQSPFEGGAMDIPHFEDDAEDLAGFRGDFLHFDHINTTS